VTPTHGVVLLRPSTAGDAPLIVAGRDEVSERFLGAGDPDPRPALCIEVEGELVGWVDHDTDRAWLKPDQVNVGYQVFPQHRGRGSATRAVRLLLEQLHDDGKIATFLIHPDNERSLALVGRLGIPRASDLDGLPYFVVEL
jgi:RimJ/RimL family protein N-acetyltransferase